MKAVATIAFSVLFLLPAIGTAQDSLVGRYNASYTVTTPTSTVIPVVIVISSVENGVVKGTGIRADRGCRGDYPLEGTLKENQIRLRSIGKGGPSGDCTFGFAGTVEGNGFVGKYGPHELKFSK